MPKLNGSGRTYLINILSCLRRAKWVFQELKIITKARKNVEEMRSFTLRK